jgi:hypothetical protein
METCAIKEEILLMEKAVTRSTSAARPPSTYEPVNLVLSRVQTLHRELITRLSLAVADGKNDGRVEYLRDSWIEVEKQRIRSLEDYRTQGDPQILDTWVQYIPIGDVAETLDDMYLDDGCSANDLLARLSIFNKALAEFYRRMGRETSIERVETLFSKLAEQTQREAANLSWRLRDE